MSAAPMTSYHCPTCHADEGTPCTPPIGRFDDGTHNTHLYRRWVARMHLLTGEIIDPYNYPYAEDIAA